jgi:surface protein
MFSHCIKLKEINGINKFNTNNVTDMEGLFNLCEELENLDLSNFNTINVNNMNGMFYNCSSLVSLNLSSFNTNNVQNMSGIFIKLNKNCAIICEDKKILSKKFK